MRAVGALPLVRVPARFARTVAAELADPLTPILGTGAAATAMLGESTDAVLVGSVTVGNALISGVQRLRAETALESLLLEQDVCARRETDGGTEEVPGSALRLGDVLQVAAGDVLAADARLLEATDLEVDESNLTGESLSVSKSVPATPGAEVADRTCMLFDGTTVVAGSGRAVVVAVGTGTEAGRAARAAGGAAPPAGVQARLGELTRAVLPLTLAGGGVVTLLGVLWGRPLREAVGSGLAIAVAAVPEGLPLVATVAQQAAARRLSKRGAVVRSARVLEALGRVDTVCFDKTGTLTENRLKVVRLVALDGEPEEEVLRLAAAAMADGDDRAHETDRAVADAAADRDLTGDGDPEACLPFATDRGFSAALRGRAPRREGRAGGRAAPLRRRAGRQGARGRAGGGGAAGARRRRPGRGRPARGPRRRRPGPDPAGAGRPGRHAARVVGGRRRAAAGRRRPGAGRDRRPPGDGRRHRRAGGHPGRRPGGHRRPAGTGLGHRAGRAGPDGRPSSPGSPRSRRSRWWPRCAGPGRRWP